jgi:hypothetical protein
VKRPGRSTLADIFISYAHDDLVAADALDRELQSFGWSVWRDDRLNVAEVIDDEIQVALDQASCVVVLWSRASVRSAWVKAEAEAADEQGKLLPISFQRDLTLPIRFRMIKMAVLTSPHLDPSEEPAAGVLAEIARLTGKTPAQLEGMAASPSAPATGSKAIAAGNWALRAQTRRARLRTAPMNLRLLPDGTAIGDVAFRRDGRWKDIDARHRFAGRWRFDLGSQTLSMELMGIGATLDQQHALTAMRVRVIEWQDRDTAVCIVDGGKGWTLERRFGV